MPFQEVVPGLLQLQLGGMVNCFLLRTAEGSILVDTGLPQHAAEIEEALAGETLKAILLTHAHSDHAGGAAHLREVTGAPVWAHALAAELVTQGRSLRALSAAPGLLSGFIYKKLIAGDQGEIPACQVDNVFEHEGPLLGGLSAIHTPGHAAGHVCFLWPEKMVLLAADVAGNVGWLRPSPAFEDFELGLQSLRKLACYPFETAVFGHGKPILKSARRRFRQRFGSPGPASEFRNSLAIAVDADSLWQQTLDVCAWPEFVPTINEVKLLDPGPVAVGTRAQIRQPGLPPAIWTVTEVEAPTRFVWQTGNALVRMTAYHEIEELPGGCLNHLRLSVSGPGAAALCGLLGARLEEALCAENLGFKARAEQAAARQGQRPA